MKLYACARGPHIEPFYTTNTLRAPAASYALECRLVTAYTTLLYDPALDVEALMRRVWGANLTPAQMYGHACKQGRIDRLDYDMAELIRSLRPNEQTPLVKLLLGESPDLVAAVQHLLSLERMLHRRLKHHSGTRLCDDRHAKAAGLGYSYERPAHRPEPTPCACHHSPSTLSPLGLILPASAPAARQPTITAPVAALAAQTLLYQVKRTQERRRLKRKRR